MKKKAVKTKSSKTKAKAAPAAKVLENKSMATECGMKCMCCNKEVGKCECTMTKMVKWKIGVLNCLAPYFYFVVRFYVAWIFLQSGLNKAQYWTTTLWLFEYEHPVPYMSPMVAAILGTGAEILFASLVIIGFATRFSAFVLLAMTVMIEYTYMANPVHIYWMMILGLLVFYGADRFSLDHWLKSRYMGCNHKN